jgi:serine/threonine protein kinase
MSVAPQNRDLPPGAAVGRFRVREVRAGGDFCRRYLAEDAAGRAVMIDELLPEELAERVADGKVVAQNAPGFVWARERFLAEGRTLAACEHPARQRVLEVFEANGTAYRVAPCDEPRTLKTWMRELGRAPTEAEVMGLLTPLLAGLDRMHAAGLYHLGIKPDAIQMTPDGQPVLAHFAGARQAVARRCQGGVAVTPGYAPPEQYELEKTESAASDIYALAAVMYRVLTGQAPPDAEERLAGATFEPLPKRLAGRYSARLLVALQAALTLDPAARPPSIAVWQRMLGAGKSAVRPVRRRKNRVAAGLAVLMLAGVLGWWLRPPPAPEPKREETTEEQAEKLAQNESDKEPAKSEEERKPEEDAKKQADEKAADRAAAEKAAVAQAAAEEAARQQQQAEAAARQAEQQRQAAEEMAKKAEAQSSPEQKAAAKRAVEQAAAAEAQARRAAEQAAALAAAQQAAAAKAAVEKVAREKTAVAKAEAERAAEEKAAHRKPREDAAEKRTMNENENPAKEPPLREAGDPARAAKAAADAERQRLAEEKAAAEAGEKRRAAEREARAKASEQAARERKANEQGSAAGLPNYYKKSLPGGTGEFGGAFTGAGLAGLWLSVPDPASGEPAMAFAIYPNGTYAYCTKENRDDRLTDRGEIRTEFGTMTMKSGKDGSIRLSTYKLRTLRSMVTTGALGDLEWQRYIVRK